MVLLAWSGVVTIAFGKGASRSVQVASTTVVVPTAANVVGATGSTFRTRISIFNPSAFSYPIEVVFHDVAGKTTTKSIPMSANQLRVYDDFLGEVFSVTGAGSLEFDSQHIAGGSSDNQFVVNAEVWTISGGGRYGTSVTTSTADGSPAEAYSPGIRVDSQFRSNVGCFNDSTEPNSVVADVFDASSNLVNSIMLTVPAGAWAQTAIPGNVSSGYVRFRPSQSAFCWAVVVNNTTNDGHFILASEFVP